MTGSYMKLIRIKAIAKKEMPPDHEGPLSLAMGFMMPRFSCSLWIRHNRSM